VHSRSSRCRSLRVAEIDSNLFSLQECESSRERHRELPSTATHSERSYGSDEEIGLRKRLQVSFSSDRLLVTILDANFARSVSKGTIQVSHTQSTNLSYLQNYSRIQLRNSCKTTAISKERRSTRKHFENGKKQSTEGDDGKEEKKWRGSRTTLRRRRKGSRGERARLR